MNALLRRITVLVVLASTLVAAVLWLTGQFARKADADAVSQLTSRVSGVERVSGRLARDLEWTEATLYAIARKLGVPVPLPPQPKGMFP